MMMRQYAEVLVVGPMAQPFLVRKDKDAVGRIPGADRSGSDLVGKMGVVLAVDATSERHPNPLFLVKIGQEKLFLRQSEIQVVR